MRDHLMLRTGKKNCRVKTPLVNLRFPGKLTELTFLHIPDFFNKTSLKI